MSVLKKSVLSLVILLLVLVVSIAGVLWWIDPNDYKAEIEQAAKQQGMTLKLSGDLGWTLFPVFGLRSGAFSVQTDPLSPVISFDKFLLSVELKPLLNKQLRVSTIQLHGGALNIPQAESNNRLQIEKFSLRMDDANIEAQAFPLVFSLTVRTFTGDTLLQSLPVKGSAQLVLTTQKMNLNNLLIEVEGSQLTGEASFTQGTPARLKAVIEGKSSEVSPLLQFATYSAEPLAKGDFTFKANISNSMSANKSFMETVQGQIDFSSAQFNLLKSTLTSSLNGVLLQVIQNKDPNALAQNEQTVLQDLNGRIMLGGGQANNESFTAKSLCTEFSGRGQYGLLDNQLDYRVAITFPSSHLEKQCAEINPRLKDIAWPVRCQGVLSEAKAGEESPSLCKADESAIRELAKKAMGKEVQKKLDSEIDKALEKKLGQDAEAAKSVLKGLFR